MSVTRQIAPENARKTADQLRALGITIPKDVRTLLDRLDQLDADRPPVLTQTDLEQAYITGASPAEVARIAADLTTHSARSNAWTEARIKVGQQALAAFTANGDDLTKALAKLAAPLIERMVDAAALDTLDTTALIRAGRSAEAEVAARVDIVAGDLEHLYRLRDRITKGAEYGASGIDCRRWMDPRKARTADALRTPPATATDAFLRGIRADAGLWFPTPGEAQAQAAPLAAEERAERDAEKAGRWGVGSVFA